MLLRTHYLPYAPNLLDDRTWILLKVRVIVAQNAQVCCALLSLEVLWRHRMQSVGMHDMSLRRTLLERGINANECHED
jgi:hypothetical protein